MATYNNPVNDLATMCQEQLGGRLVEIQSEAELNFFNNFLKKAVNDFYREHILLGATYHNDVWQYLSSQDTISYARWYSSEAIPSDSSQHCMYWVWNGHDEGMHSWVCKDGDTRLVCQTGIYVNGVL